MNLKPIKANMNEVELANANVLFSYRTPVALQIKSTGEVFKTSKYWSRTTSRHINQWVKEFTEPEKVKEKPQEYFDEFSNEVK